VLLFEAMIWLRNLLALTGVLTVMFLLTSSTSSKGSLELSVGKETRVPSGTPAATADDGLVILPINSQ
jgi:hypothetical protein